MTNRGRTFTLAGALATSGALATALLTTGPAPPQVSVADVNPGTSVERDLCLSVSLAPGAASECGDLRLAHALPAVRTLGRARAPVLLYNSQHASPHPIVAAHVTLPDGPSGLSRVVATLKVNGTPRGQGVWKGSAWPDVTGPVRIAVGYDAASDSTGPYRYTLEVRAHYGETTLADTARGELVVVNRRESAFGAGWWLAGLERLVMDPFGKPVLWVGGDGSTRRYTNAGGGDVWGAPSLDRPDSIKREGEKWVRILSGGVKVEFDSTGRHVATVNRLTHRTEFRYDTAGRVEAVTIPQAAAGQEFAFHYAADGKLERMESPGVGGTPRVTHLHRNGARVDSIRGPDTTSIGFGYADDRALVPTSRRNRMRVATYFRYDAAGRVAASRLDLSTTESIVHRLRAHQSLGLATSTGTGAVDTARAYALLDGPRSDVGDSTRLWLDRWGAPRRIRNAEGRETILTRGDPRFPALVTRMDGPLRADSQRRTMAASYDARGNLVAQTDSSTFEERLVPDPGGGQASNRRVYAITRYEYNDPRWPDFPTRTVLPEGESTSFGYDSLSGSRIWQKPSGDVQRDDTVRFAYYTSTAEQGYAPGLLRAVTYAKPPPEIIERRVCGGRDLICTTVEDTVYPPPRTEKVEYDARGTWSTAAPRWASARGPTTTSWAVPGRRSPPIEGGPNTNLVTTVNTFYENTDLVKESRTYAPLLSGTAPGDMQTAWVARGTTWRAGHASFRAALCPTGPGSTPSPRSSATTSPDASGPKWPPTGRRTARASTPPATRSACGRGAGTRSPWSTTR
jgi:YD repeat-containing protein